MDSERITIVRQSNRQYILGVAFISSVCVFLFLLYCLNDKTVFIYMCIIPFVLLIQQLYVGKYVIVSIVDSKLSIYNVNKYGELIGMLDLDDIVHASIKTVICSCGDGIGSRRILELKLDAASQPSHKLLKASSHLAKLISYQKDDVSLIFDISGCSQKNENILKSIITRELKRTELLRRK